jgi:hypothetical protein
MSFAILFGLLLIWGAVLFVHKATGRPGGIWSCAYSWFVIVWIVQFILLSLPIFEYFDPITSKGALVIVGAHLVFALGMMASMALTPRAKPDLSNLGGSRGFVLLTSLIGAGSQIILSINNLVGSGVPIASRLNPTTLAQTRLTNFEFNPYFLGPLFGPMSVAASLCFVVIPYFAFCWARGERWTRTLSSETLLVATTILAVVAAQMLNSGRQNLLFLGLLIAIPALLGRKFSGKQEHWALTQSRRSFFIAATIALSILSSVFQSFRDQAESPLSHMGASHGTSVTEPFYNMSSSNNLGGWYLLQLSYITTPPHVLSIYAELPKDQQPGPFWGRYNFHILYRNVFRFAPGYDPEFWTKDRKELFRPQVWLGRNGNVWATLLRDLTGDFGTTGMLLFMGMFGIFVQRQEDNFASGPSPARAALVAILRVICLFSALISVFFMAWTVAALLILTAVAALAKNRAAGVEAAAQVNRRRRLSQIV